MKSQGTSKIQTHCTAGFQQEHITANNVIKVFICKTHYGHSPILGHLRLQERYRAAIVGMLTQGVSMERILDKVRDSVGSNLERLHLITKKDIHNIERSFGVRQEQRHSDDATSVYLWVKEMVEKGESNPVLYYKQQGTKIAEIGQSGELGINDFVLVIQTPLQADILKKCGERKVVCVDATHGTNAYNFHLISVVVVDEYGEGFPCGWCISNKQDGAVSTLFFKYLRQKTGEINSKWFMSDMAEQFYTSWVAVYGGRPKKLVCTWHVDNAWKKNLHLINDKTIQVDVYYMLKVLMDETDETKFRTMLNNTLEGWKRLDDDMKDFYSYFRHYYANKVEEWAACYRVKAGINTNMYVESFHKVLKYIYLKGKINKRMDRCIYVLMKYCRDKAFNRILKLEKGKSTNIKGMHK